MPIKRLLDSVVFGFGATAGAKLFDELAQKLEAGDDGGDDVPPPTKPEVVGAKRAAKARARAARRREAEIEKELAALKRRLRR